METASISCKVHQCSKCLGATEYYCVSCPCDLCFQCKENHVTDLQTIDHTVVSHRDKLNYIPTQEICVIHPCKVYIKYCEPCELPVCYHCRKHRNHRKIDVKTAYKTKQLQHIGTIHTIRSEALFYRPVLLTGIKADFKTCHTEFSLYQSEMLTKAQTLKNFIHKVKKDFMYNVFCDLDFKHRCLKQKIEMSEYIVSIQRYVHSYEQPAFRFSALQFLSTIKTAFPQMHLTLHTSQLSMTESLNKENVMESLSAIQITERGNRRVGNKYLLKLTSGAEFHQSLTLTGVHGCLFISCVTSDRVWVSDSENNLILTSTKSVPLHRMKDSCSDLYSGLHTVNSERELIYIDRNYNIKKLSNDLKTTTTFIERTDYTWRPQCLYWSPSNEDLLVGMWNYDTHTGKVIRYNQSGQQAQTPQHGNTGLELYSEPNFITENNNGDVVVSDWFKGVVVTEHRGRHRFSYTGHPSGSGLEPWVICTDALSHILVCDHRTYTVQMIDKDGQFLSHLLTRPSGIFLPYSLNYDVNTHRLWVGSRYKNTVVIYRYITRHDDLTDLNPATADMMESLSEIKTTETEKPKQANQELLILMSPPELIHSLTLTGVDGCNHISCVTSDRVWISDENNLILTSRTGVALHRVEDSCSGLYGMHTVNSEHDLIFIDRNYNINKLSKDLKSNTTFIERTDSTWRPQCVYLSPSTGDLLVAMYNSNTETCKVTRYNQRGELTQTIQHDSTGLELYSEPNFITENNNGDVVVSDYDYMSGAVVVTRCGGRHRFSYTGPPSGSGLQPWGICTDALSHILVCDDRTNTVQMIDKDGQFLSHLLTKSQDIGRPRNLSYDVNTHSLLVGSRSNNTVVIYRCITRKDDLTGRTENNKMAGSSSELTKAENCFSKEGLAHEKMTSRKIPPEDKESVEKKVLYLYKYCESFILSDECTQDLRNEFEESIPDCLTILRKWINDLEKSDHGIVIAGETSAGKSTLINKLLGKQLFKGRNNESTSTICKLRNSEGIRVITTNMTGEKEETDLTDKCNLETKEGVKMLRDFLKDLTDLTSSEKSVTFKSVEVEFPIPLLKGNMILVDTPGIGGWGNVTDKLIEYIPNVLLFIFVINAGSAGGMQNDRLPEIIRAIVLLHLENEIPCFDLRNVIFITNKWDTLYSEDDSSDEDEETKTWNTQKSDIKRRWPSVREELIFKMNLKNVSSGKTNSSITNFEEFKRMLKTMVKTAENNRLLQHLRFLQQVLTPLSKGLNARIELEKKTEEECLSLLERHRQKIDGLTMECKQAREKFLEKNTKVKEDIAQECYDYMLTDAGKQRVLNPPDRTPITDVNWGTTDFEKEIEARVDSYVEKFLQSDGVLKSYECIQKEINTFCEHIISDLFGMEKEWIETVHDTWSFSPSNVLLSLGVLISPVWMAALAVGFGLTDAVFASFAFTGGAIWSLIKRKTNEEIDREYNRHLAKIRSNICDHLDKNCGVVIIKLIDKVTEDVLPKKLQTFKTMIQQISETKDKIKANQKRVKVNADKIRNMENMVTQLAECLNS